MSGKMYGANTEALREIGHGFGAAAQDIANSSTHCTNEIRAVAWEGADRERFVSHYEQQVDALCQALSQRLDELGGNELPRQADEQDEASGAKGSGADDIRDIAGRAPNDDTQGIQDGDSKGPSEQKAHDTKIADKGEHTRHQGGVPTEPDDITTLDTNQGGIGDCWMIASMAALAGTEEGRKLLSRNIEYDAKNDQYKVTLYDNGEPVEVIVDNSFLDSTYIGEDGETYLFRHAGGDDRQPNYASIYEKAMAEYYGDTYGEIWGGHSKEALEVLTGNEATCTSTDPGLRFWEQKADSSYIRDKLDGGEVVTMGTKSEDDMPEGSKIVPGHAYVVQEVLDDGSLVVYNPWGEGSYHTEGYDDGQVVIPADKIDDYFVHVDSVKP